MSGHLGTIARLVPAVPTEAQQETAPSRYSYQSARSRVWAFDASGPSGMMPRSWSIDTSLLDSREARVLGEFLDGQWGPGPFLWVPCSAHDGNALTPRQSALYGVATGSADGVDGWAPKAHLGPTSVVLAATVPVPPGQPVSAGVDMSGGTLTLTWRNGSGAVVGTASKAASGSVMQRVAWSGVAPATARSVDLTVSGHTAATRPQVVWASSLPAYVPGQTAASVVIDTGQLDMIAPGYWSSSVTLVEVG